MDQTRRNTEVTHNQKEKTVTFGKTQMDAWKKRQGERKPNFLTGEGTESEPYLLAKAYRDTRSKLQRSLDDSISKGTLASEMLEKCTQRHRELSKLAEDDSLVQKVLTMSGRELQEKLDENMKLAQSGAGVAQAEHDRKAKTDRALGQDTWQSSQKEKSFNVLSTCLDRFQFMQWRLNNPDDQGRLDENSLDIALKRIQESKQDIRAFMAIMDEMSQRMRECKSAIKVNQAYLDYTGKPNVIHTSRERFDNSRDILLDSILFEGRDDKHPYSKEAIDSAPEQFREAVRELVSVMEDVKDNEIPNDFHKHVVSEINQNRQKLQFMISKLSLEESSRRITEHCVDRLKVFDQLRKLQHQSDHSGQDQRNSDVYEQEQLQTKKEAMVRLDRIQDFAVYLKTFDDSSSSTNTPGLVDQPPTNTEQLKQQFQTVLHDISSKSSVNTADERFDKMKQGFELCINESERLNNEINALNGEKISERLNPRQRDKAQDYNKQKILELQKYAHYHFMWIKEYQKRLLEQ